MLAVQNQIIEVDTNEQLGVIDPFIGGQEHLDLEQLRCYDWSPQNNNLLVEKNGGIYLFNIDDYTFEYITDGNLCLVHSSTTRWITNNTFVYLNESGASKLVNVYDVSLNKNILNHSIRSAGSVDDFSVSNTGKMIAFVSTLSSQQHAPNPKLLVFLDLDSGKEKVFQEHTGGGSTYAASGLKFIDNDQKIMFVEYYEIKIYDIKSSTTTSLIINPSPELKKGFISELAISGDYNTLAYHSYTGSEHEIRLVDIKTKNEKAIFVGKNPRWVN